MQRPSASSGVDPRNAVSHNNPYVGSAYKDTPDDGIPGLPQRGSASVAMGRSGVGMQQQQGVAVGGFGAAAAAASSGSSMSRPIGSGGMGSNYNQRPSI